MSLIKDGNDRAFIVLVMVVLLVAATLNSFSNGTPSIFRVPKDDGSRGPSFKVCAWTFPWDKDSFSSVKRWAGSLDEVSPYWYWAYANGSVQRTHKDSENVEFVTFCRKNDIDIIPMVSNNHDPDIVRSICRDPFVQDLHIGELMNLTLMFNFDGLDINYESIRTEDRDFYSSFIYNLSNRLHSRGKVLSVSVFPKVADMEYREGPDAYDYRSLSQSADQLRIMAYNLHWSSCPEAGPIQSYPWVDEVLRYTSSVVPNEKVVLGVPQFSYDWRVDKNGRTLSVAVNRSHSEITGIIAEYNAERNWDSIARTPYIEYKGNDGYLHSLHYCDRESLYHQLKFVDLYSVRGISIWKIGGEDTSSSSMIEAAKGFELGDLPPFMEIGDDIVGTKGMPIDIGPIRAYDIEGRLAFIEWDLGDGNRTNELEPVHIYSSGGFYTATLTLEDEFGQKVSDEKEVRIGPYADLRVEGRMEVGIPVTFNGTNSWDPKGLVSYNWDLGDGTYRFHDLPTIEHVFSRPGHFWVALTVISSTGFVDTGTLLIIVPDRTAPVADAGPDMMVWEDSYVTLDGSGSWDSSGVLDLNWTVSDGRTMKGICPTLTFPDPGTYRVLLDVRDPSGNRDIDEMAITVRDRTPPEISLVYASTGTIGTSIELNASGSHDNVGIVQFSWDTGGGVTIRDQESILLDLVEARSYFITLEVLDAEMNWNSTTVQVQALDVEPPSAVMNVIPAPVPMNMTYLCNYSFLSGVTEDERFLGAILREETYIFSLGSVEDKTGIATICWTFGDGATAGGPIVYHSYSGSGLYKGKFEVTDLFNNTMSMDFSLVAIPSYDEVIAIVQRTNISYLNTTVHVRPDREMTPLLEKGTVVLLSGTLVLVIILFVDLMTATRSIRTRLRWKRKVNVP